MIRNQSYVFLESTELKSCQVGAIHPGEKMVFWHNDSCKINAAVDRCSHRGVALSVGKIQSDHSIYLILGNSF